jgi:hypothetical protein
MDSVCRKSDCLDAKWYHDNCPSGSPQLYLGKYFSLYEGQLILGESEFDFVKDTVFYTAFIKMPNNSDGAGANFVFSRIRKNQASKWTLREIRPFEIDIKL